MLVPMDGTYPPPPWHTHGFGVSAAYVVPTRHVMLPPELEAVTVAAGRGPGMISYIEYQAPSPLTYHELIWMPAYVRSVTPTRGRATRGWYVARMYVDDARSLQAGRQEWALPKTLARFNRTEHGVTVDADDGTHLALTFRQLGPSWRARGKMATLQVRDGQLVRFRAEFRARVAPALLRVRAFASHHEAWAPYPHAHRVPLAAGMMPSFESIMRVPSYPGHESP
jgi:hypothetical protein